MKMLLTSAIAGKLLRASGLLMIALGLAIGYGAATSTSANAQARDGGSCTVCHKNRDTIVLPCGDIEFRRHMAHGDTAGPCPTSPPRGTRADIKKEEITPVAPIVTERATR